jgi:hypothetical protein
MYYVLPIPAFFGHHHLRTTHQLLPATSISAYHVITQQRWGAGRLVPAT